MWLCDAGETIRTHNVSKPDVPISAYVDLKSFKVFLLDVGLLRAMSGVSPKVILDGSRIFEEFKGALTEQFVCQELQQFSDTLQTNYYWTSSATSEIDFIISDGLDVYPLEVKAGVTMNAKSLKLYVEKYFPEKSKQKMLDLVNNLKEALGEHIAALEWMSDKTKENAKLKLDAFRVKIGYPDKWKDYSGLTVDPKLSYWENVKAARKFRADEQYAKWGKPVDREEWGMTPQTVNAYYNPTTNEICFPAGILQAPYFDVDADDACNYGAIGVVIGNEMTHLIFR